MASRPVIPRPGRPRPEPDWPRRAARISHDVGLAAWFGGSLMGAVGVHAATAQSGDAQDRDLAVVAAWASWSPLNVLAVLTHVAGAAGLLVADRRRVVARPGVAAAAVVKTALTGAGLLAEVSARRVARRHTASTAARLDGSPAPAPVDIDDLAMQVRRARLVTAACAGAMVVMGSVMGEQQRDEVLRSRWT